MCPNCKNSVRTKKTKPYGSKRTRAWCHACDSEYCPPEPNKKRERSKAKQDIKKEAGGH